MFEMHTIKFLMAQRVSLFVSNIIHTNTVMLHVFVVPLVQAPNFPELEGLGRLFILY